MFLKLLSFFNQPLHDLYSINSTRDSDYLTRAATDFSRDLLRPFHAGRSFLCECSGAFLLVLRC